MRDQRVLEGATGDEMCRLDEASSRFCRRSQGLIEAKQDGAGEILGLAMSSCIAIGGFAKAACERGARQIIEGADAFEPEARQQKHRRRIEPERGNGEGGERLARAAGWRHDERRSRRCRGTRQRMGRTMRIGETEAGGEAEVAQARVGIVEQGSLATEKMRGACDVGPKAIAAVDVGARAIAAHPAGEVEERALVALGLGGCGFEIWKRRARIGERHAGRERIGGYGIDGGQSQAMHCRRHERERAPLIRRDGARYGFRVAFQPLQGPIREPRGNKTRHRTTPRALAGPRAARGCRGSA
jgi:hypothetical protein